MQTTRIKEITKTKETIEELLTREQNSVSFAKETFQQATEKLTDFKLNLLETENLLKEVYLAPRKKVLKKRRKDILKSIQGYERMIRNGTSQIKSLFTLGYLPTQPPAGWYCGTMEKIESSFNLDKEANKAHLNIPQTQDRYGTWYSRVDSQVFIGHTPKQVYDTYRKVSRVVGKYNMLVASPDATVFGVGHVEPVCDPILFALVPEAGVWFRVACWDLDKDLKQMNEEEKRK